MDVVITANEARAISAMVGQSGKDNQFENERIRIGRVYMSYEARFQIWIKSADVPILVLDTSVSTSGGSIGPITVARSKVFRQGAWIRYLLDVLIPEEQAKFEAAEKARRDKAEADRKARLAPIDDALLFPEVKE